MNFYSKIVVTIALLCAVVNPAKADSYTTDGAGRKYLVPSAGDYAGKNLMELSADNLNGRYKIRCKKNTDFGFDVSGGGTPGNSTNIQIWGVNQEFELIYVSGGNYRIRYAGGTNNNMYVNTSNNGTNKPNFNTGENEKTPVNINVYTLDPSSKDQLFKFIKNDDGSFTIASSWDENWVFDVEGGTMEQGKNIRFWESNKSDAQKWLLEPVSLTNTGRTIPDYYFERYLVEQGFVQVYNQDTHSITGTAKNADYGLVDAGYHEHMVIVNPEQITELNKLGEYGKYWTEGTGNYSKHFQGVKDLKGIEYFTNLKKLDMSRHIPGDDFNNYGNNYTRLNPSGVNLQYNTQLEYVNFDYADFKTGSLLSSSHIYDLENLKFLNLSNNYLTEIDLDQFPVLERFQACHNFDLRTIKANIENRNMKELAIFDSMFGWKDGNEDNGALQALINNFPNLVFLHAYATPNYELDLTQHHELQSIWLLKSAYGASQGLVYDGVYNIVSYKDHALGFDCAGGSSAEKTNVQLWTIDRNATHHQFKITKVTTENGVNWYSIKPNHNTGMAVDVSGASTTDGANIQLWTYNGNAAQLFAFVRNDDGSYKIVSKLNGSSVLDIASGNVKQGTNIQLWHDNGSDAQKWVLLPVDLTITAGQAGSARQIGKGPWLHKLDLSGCEKLRDIHVQNMHLASLNLNSEFIKQPLSDEYKDWTFCREVTNASGVYGAGKLVPGVEVYNNYRHVNVIPYKQYDEEKRKWYWMFYLRLTYNENGTKETERSLVLDNQTSYFETMTLDTYNDYSSLGSMSRKEFQIENFLKEDLFDGHRVTGCYEAKETDNINSTGLMAHNKPDKDQPDTYMPMCTIEHDGTDEPVVNYGTVDAGTKAFLDHFHKKVNGRIVVLKAGVSDTESFIVPDDVPKTIMYTYNMNHYSGNQNAAPARRGVSVKENTDPIEGMFYFDLHYPVVLDSSVVTGIEESVLETNKEVASVKYYNVAGQESVVPFRGINIVKVTYTDGTSTASKVIK